MQLHRKMVEELLASVTFSIAGGRTEVTAQSCALYEELCAAYPEHLPVHVARLQALDASLNDRSNGGSAPSAGTKAQLTSQLLAVADTILASVNQEKLLAFYGMKTDQRPDASKIKT